ncbi:MAG: dTDP-4-dehydrorhamnose 3,5-epimerase family protein [Halobacteriales archaeon]|nr:dTDP-4-dehydrorhamnose 3,5-epimerase family protein [Halobacteriales archaeon]
MPSDEPPIAPEFAKQLATQSYASKPRIEGVQLVDLKRFVEDGGEFQELARLGPGAELQGVPGFVLKQVNYSIMQPGAIKAWHLHKRQEDAWFVPPNARLLVALLDTREGKHGASMRLVLGDGRAQLLLIPRGVAHGAANPYPAPQPMLYFVNQQFDAQHPDEHRLPWDLLGKEFWQLQPG